ncbi:MAG: class I SAM-dependent methyltransferase [Planctomycetota bacterium]
MRGLASGLARAPAIRDVLDMSEFNIADDWFLAAFGCEYLEIYAHRDAAAAAGEVRFAVDALGLAPGAHVLDLCCGAGRHFRELRARALRVVGLDRSRPLLAAARRALGGGAELVEADMRRLPFASAFDAVFLFFTSFGYFRTDDDNRRVLVEIARVLRPGGALLLDIADKASLVRGLVPASRRELDGRVIEESRRITADGKRVEKLACMTLSDGGVKRFGESVRLYDREELAGEFRAAGLRLDRCYGDFDGSEQRPGISPRLIAIARRAEA